MTLLAKSNAALQAEYAALQAGHAALQAEHEALKASHRALQADHEALKTHCTQKAEYGALNRGCGAWGRSAPPNFFQGMPTTPNNFSPLGTFPPLGTF